MANITVSAAGVAKGSNATFETGVAGATITAGQVLYKDTSDSNKLKLAISTTLAASQVAGIALHGASAGQPIQFQTDGDLLLVGTTLGVGAVIVLSATAGAMCPSADLDATTGTSYCSVLGVTTVDGSANPVLRLGIRNSSSLNP